MLTLIFWRIVEHIWLGFQNNFVRFDQQVLLDYETTLHTEQININAFSAKWFKGFQSSLHFWFNISSQLIVLFFKFYHVLHSNSGTHYNFILLKNPMTPIAGKKISCWCTKHSRVFSRRRCIITH
jgi:hypothetical protein